MAKKRIGILTGGGDCPGINAVIRAVAKKAMLDHDMEVLGFPDAYYGLVNNKYRELDYEDVSGILTRGGTILGTSKIYNPYRYAVKIDGKLHFEDRSAQAVENAKKLDLDCLVVIGGDGTLALANMLYRDGVPIVGVPKTIDNDLKGTDVTFGFDSAVAVATDAIDRVHTTAESHHRVMIVEVMGHHAGWIALHSGIAGGGDVILIPEIEYKLEYITKEVQKRNKKGKRFTIIVVAEGAKPKGGEQVIKRKIAEATDSVRLGGIGPVLANEIEDATGIATRTVVLGHLQRGGTPTPTDRVLATSLGTKAVELIENGDFGQMVSVSGRDFTKVALKDVATGPRTIPTDHPLIASARSVGTCFGDK